MHDVVTFHVQGVKKEIARRDTMIMKLIKQSMLHCSIYLAMLHYCIAPNY